VKLKDILTALESEIIELQDQLTEIKGLHNPVAPAALQKEKAYYLIEIQRGTQEVAQNKEMSQERRRQIASCTAHPRYRRFLELGNEINRLSQKKLGLRQIVSQAQIQMQDLPVFVIPVDEDSRKERDALRRNIETKVHLLRMDERRKARSGKKRRELRFLIREIEEMNDRMRDVGLGKSVVETAEWRERLLGQKHCEEEEEEQKEQVFATRTSLKAKKRKKWGITDGL
jgi:hypothetical protein